MDDVVCYSLCASAAMEDEEDSSNIMLFITKRLENPFPCQLHQMVTATMCLNNKQYENEIWQKLTSES